MGYVLLCDRCPHEFGVYEDTTHIPDNPDCPHVAKERQDALMKQMARPPRERSRA